MGKAADNERKKLKATFYNNIGAGMMLGGFLVPYLGFVGKIGSIVASFQAGHWPSFEEKANVTAAAVAMALALWGAKHLRRMSDHVATQIEGD
ncbi:hypothetical protein ACLBYG_22025 [Methylobacterium sp. D53M]